MIVIPMAGLSRRFTEAGYSVPKYMLPAHGRSVFAHAVGSFAAYARSLPFLFIVRDVCGTPDFVRAECATLGLSDLHVVVLDAPTAGQAETVEAGVRRAGISPDTPLTIFNIDTFRPDFRFPTQFDIAEVDGYIEVFLGAGANWSYVKAAGPSSNRVIETAEKRSISDLCCTGLYHFHSAGHYLDAYRQFVGGASAMGLSELYVAPMYNILIAKGADIRFTLIAPNKVIFCGLPSEYEAFVATRP